MVRFNKEIVVLQMFHKTKGYPLYNHCTICGIWEPKPTYRCPECNRKMRTKPIDNHSRAKRIMNLPRH